MGIVSFAQNLEDVVLWRALGKIQGGFYIDVGANDPSIDSVTHAFYERGWHGINIEPLRTHYLDLVHQRPRDINLCCAIGSEKGEIDVWECDVRGWATASRDVIDQHQAAGHEGQFVKVPLTTLAAVCELHAPDVIHFLKIDVEGLEESVLRGADFQRFRPWIVIVEATRPNSPDAAYAQWEGLLTGASYVFAYADGLNRFYVATEQAALTEKFKYPPNVFDEYSVASAVDLHTRVVDLENALKERDTRTQARQVALERELKERDAQLEDLRAAKTAQDSLAAEELDATQERAANAEMQLVLQVTRYAEAEARLAQAEGRAEQAEARSEQAQMRSDQAELRSERAETRAALSLAHIERLATRSAEAAAQASNAQDELQAAERKAALLGQRATLAEEHVRAMQVSTSWRVTAPLRAVGRPFRRLISAMKEGRIRSGLERRVRTLVKATSASIKWRSTPPAAISHENTSAPAVETASPPPATTVPELPHSTRPNAAFMDTPPGWIDPGDKGKNRSELHGSRWIA